MNEEKIYYSFRMGMKKGNISSEELNILTQSLYEKYDREEYFRVEFGYYDFNHNIKGRKGIKMSEDIILTFPGRKIWPISENYPFYDETTCFDLIEYFYDHACEYVPEILPNISEDFYIDARNKFRKDTNKILSIYKDGKYELMPNGEIYIRIKDNLKKIVLDRPKSKDNENINNKRNG